MREESPRYAIKISRGVALKLKQLKKSLKLRSVDAVLVYVLETKETEAQRTERLQTELCAMRAEILGKCADIREALVTIEKPRVVLTIDNYQRKNNR